MPKPKKSNRSYEARAGSPLEGLHLVQQRQPQTAADINSNLPGTEGTARKKALHPDAELVEKLIQFIKSL